MVQLPPRDVMIRAYKTSNADYDGVFLLAVRTTGVFCRPSCTARKPFAQNVEFFSTSREALFAGYRPCKRCEPMRLPGKTPGWIASVLQIVERQPDRRVPDASLRAMGVDPARVRRYFQKQFGITFQAYCRGRRLSSALEQIRKGTRLDDIALGFGYESHSGFREAFTRTYGIPPGKAARADSLLVCWLETPLGPMIAGATEESLVLLEFTERRMLERQFAILRRRFRRPIVPGNNKILTRTKTELQEYFRRERTEFTVPVSFPGSLFQQNVWHGLRGIPFGTTVSYEELARRIGSPAAQRAVGNSNGLNRIGIIVPCHRVVKKDGSVGGYGGGVWRKQALLEFEQGLRDFTSE